MLKEHPFSDLYLGEKSENCWLSGIPKTSDPIPAPADCAEELAELRRKCDEFHENSKKAEFAIAHSGTRYRASLLRSMSEDVYVLRRFPEQVPVLESLNIHSHYVDLFMTPHLSGLIVIAGPFSQGKTTTASAIVAGRIAKHGGVAVCIEDPPEMPLEGRRGEGVIYQRWVDQGGFAYECRQVARWAPSIIFVGEVRDAETATEALRASVNGRLVVCTIHSDDVKTAVERLYTLANGTAGNSDDVSSLMASGLAAVCHQKLEGEPKRPKIEFLWLRGESQAGVCNMIRQRRFELLNSEIKLQQNSLLFNRRSNGQGPGN